MGLLILFIWLISYKVFMFLIYKIVKYLITIRGKMCFSHSKFIVVPCRVEYIQKFNLEPYTFLLIFLKLLHPLVQFFLMLQWWLLYSRIKNVSFQNGRGKPRICLLYKTRKYVILLKEKRDLIYNRVSIMNIEINFF